MYIYNGRDGSCKDKRRILRDIYTYIMVDVLVVRIKE